MGKGPIHKYERAKGQDGQCKEPSKEYFILLYMNIMLRLGGHCKNQSNSPNRFICRGSGGLGNTGLGPKRANAGKPRTTFVRRRGTSCMSPSPLCGEMVGRATFDRKTHMNWHKMPSKAVLKPGWPWWPQRCLLGVSWEPPESFLKGF